MRCFPQKPRKISQKANHRHISPHDDGRKNCFLIFRLLSVRAVTAAFACRLENWIFMVELREQLTPKAMKIFPENFTNQQFPQFHAARRLTFKCCTENNCYSHFIVDPSFFFFFSLSQLSFSSPKGRKQQAQSDVMAENERKFNLQFSHIAVSYQFLIQCIHRLGFDFDLIRCYDCSRVKMETIKIVIEE